MQSRQRRPLAAYALSGLMIVLAVIFGGFFLVWCGLLRFLFNGWQGVLLLPALAFIAWRAFEAARAAWDGLPEAPPNAIAVLISLQVLVVLDQVGARISGAVAGITLTTLIPHIGLLGLMAAIFFVSPGFEGHRIEADLPLEHASATAHEPDDDDDLMYLGGA